LRSGSERAEIRNRLEAVELPKRDIHMECV
jgi:hypothetical protein